MDRAGSRLSRRQFVVGTGAVASLLGCGRLPGQAPPARALRIGLLGATPLSPGPQALRDSLHELGYRDGETITLETRWTEGRPDRARELAAELVELPVDLIVAPTGVEALAAKQATTTIPIVIVVAGDPVGTGLVASLARPGGNITGTTMITTPLGTKRLELLKRAVPGVARIAVLWNPTAEKVLEWQEIQRAALILGVELLSLEVRTPEDFEGAFQSATRDGADALLPLPEPVGLSQGTRLLGFAEQSRLPAIYAWREFAEAGGLMAYGPSITTNYRRAAYYVDRILRGTKPADLPVEQPMTFDFVVNLKTAQALGITFPNEIMLQVTEVIQ
jgi:putative tryptophan/tyrosine transport system substrate-binding protein